MIELRPPVSAGDEVELEIESYANEGEGVGRPNGFAVFVPGAIIGEKVTAVIDTVKRSYARGHIAAIQRPSPERVDPVCRLYRDCGGCQLLHLSYQGQLEMKRKRVIDTLTHIGGLTDVVVHPVMGMADPWHYRNKVQYPFGVADGEIIAGCYAKRTHRVVPTDDCAIQHPANSQVILGVRRLASKFGLSVYDEISRKGLLRYVLVKHAHGTDEMMVVLVTNSPHFPRGREFAARLAAEFPEVKSVVQNVNTAPGNRVLGERSVVLWGNDGIMERLDGLEIRVSATAFYQVNPLQTMALYGKAIEYAGLTGSERVLDAYCGVGALTLLLAWRAIEAYGVEVVEPAVRDARNNAVRNGIDNVRFIAGRVERVLPELSSAGVNFDVAVVDPPRAGCEPEALHALAGLSVQRLVYVSCNPSTLSRDLRILSELGYAAVEVQPVDMFPHTSHIEAVALAVRR